MTDLKRLVDRAAEFQLHPLGFHYVRDVFGETARRVHIWLPDGKGGAEKDQHQHPFDIESSVVLGGLKSELYEFKEEQEGNTHEFAVSYGTGTSSLMPTGRRGFLEVIASFDTLTGGRYWLKAGTIHRVSILQRPCVTVVTTIDRGVSIFSYGSSVPEEPFERRRATALEISEIEDVLSKSGI